MAFGKLVGERSSWCVSSAFPLQEEAVSLVLTTSSFAVTADCHIFFLCCIIIWTTRHFLSLSYFKVLCILSCLPGRDLPGCPALAAACVGVGGGLPMVP